MYSRGTVTVLAESARILSLACCWVSTGDCACADGARSPNARTAPARRHPYAAPSLAGCICPETPRFELYRPNGSVNQVFRQVVVFGSELLPESFVEFRQWLEDSSSRKATGSPECAD